MAAHVSLAEFVSATFAHSALPDCSTVSGLLLVLAAVPSMVAEGWLVIWLLTTRRLSLR